MSFPLSKCFCETHQYIAIVHGILSPKSCKQCYNYWLFAINSLLSGYSIKYKLHHTPYANNWVALLSFLSHIFISSTTLVLLNAYTHLRWLPSSCAYHFSLKSTVCSISTMHASIFSSNMKSETKISSKIRENFQLKTAFEQIISLSKYLHKVVHVRTMLKWNFSDSMSYGMLNFVATFSHASLAKKEKRQGLFRKCICQSLNYTHSHTHILLKPKLHLLHKCAHSKLKLFCTQNVFFFDYSLFDLLFVLIFVHIVLFSYLVFFFSACLLCTFIRIDLKCRILITLI